MLTGCLILTLPRAWKLHNASCIPYPIFSAFIMDATTYTVHTHLNLFVLQKFWSIAGSMQAPDEDDCGAELAVVRKGEERSGMF